MDIDKKVVRAVTWVKDSVHHAVIEVNRGELVIQVTGYGHGDGKVTISGTKADGVAERLTDVGIGADENGAYTVEQFGVCLVYASTTTFGHAIADMLDSI